MKSWKIGAIAGLIAGIVGGIVTVISLILIGVIGLPHYFGFLISDYPFLNLVIIEFILFVIWGILLGIVYLKIFDLIPGKSIWKGITFSMICYLVYNIRTGMLYYHYGAHSEAISNFLAGFCTWIIFGLTLENISNFFYERNIGIKEKRKVRKYNLGSGIYPGAFAGLIYGITVFIYLAILFDPELYNVYLEDVDFLIGQLGTHAFFNLIWGIIFGILFIRFYDAIPGKNILKGLIYMFVIYLITSFRVAIYLIAYGMLLDSYSWALGILMVPVFGIILGALCKPKK